MSVNMEEMSAKFITSWTLLNFFFFFWLVGYSHRTAMFEFKRKLLQNGMGSDGYLNLESSFSLVCHQVPRTLKFCKS